MAKKLFTRDFKVGLMVVTAISLLFFGLNFLKGQSFLNADNAYFVCLDEVSGLQKSVPVNIKGFKVGQIADIKYVPENQHPFLLTLFIHKKMRIPATAKVEIYEDGLLGGKAVRVVFSEKDLNEITFRSGDTIPSFVSGGLMSQIQNDLMQKISALATSADSLMQTFRLIAQSSNLQNSLANMEFITVSLSASSQQLNAVLNSNLPRLLSGIDTITSDLQQFSGKISRIEFEKTVNSLDATVKNLQTLTEQLNSNDGTLGALVNDKQLYINLKNATDNANKLLIDLRENPKRYVHFSIW